MSSEEILRYRSRKLVTKTPVIKNGIRIIQVKRLWITEYLETSSFHIPVQPEPAVWQGLYVNYSK